MRYQQYYGGLIWTNHAIEQMKRRGLSQEMAHETFSHPNQSERGKTKDSFKYSKRFEDALVTVIAKQNEKREWVVLSAWIDPPLPGSIDAKEKEQYKKYQKASFYGKLWLTLKKQLTGW